MESDASIPMHPRVLIALILRLFVVVMSAPVEVGEPFAQPKESSVSLIATHLLVSAVRGYPITDALAMSVPRQEIRTVMDLENRVLPLQRICVSSAMMHGLPAVGTNVPGQGTISVLP
jgi:hypothetical protein